MKGQLWQECPVCDGQPVCVDCELCARHCDCAQRADDADQVRQFEQRNPGLLERVQRHSEQGAAEH